MGNEKPVEIKRKYVIRLINRNEYINRELDNLGLYYIRIIRVSLVGLTFWNLS